MASVNTPVNHQIIFHCTLEWPPPPPPPPHDLSFNQMPLPSLHPSLRSTWRGHGHTCHVYMEVRWPRCRPGGGRPGAIFIMHFLCSPGLVSSALSTCLCLPACLGITLSTHLSFYLSICLSNSLSFVYRKSFNPFFSVCLSLRIFIYLLIHVSIYLCVCLSVSLSIYPYTGMFMFVFNDTSRLLDDYLSINVFYLSWITFLPQHFIGLSCPSIEHLNLPIIFTVFSYNLPKYQQFHLSIYLHIYISHQLSCLSTLELITLPPTCLIKGGERCIRCRGGVTFKEYLSSEGVLSSR